MKEQLQQLLASFLQLIFALLNPFVLVPASIIIVIVVLIKKNKEYKNGAYFQITKLPYRTVRCDMGRYGEYLIYMYLKNFEVSGAKFLFNAYIPKENGETSEIDVLMICSKGIFVFESKNYSGWIFGNETQRYWYQTLPSGRGRSHKESFYNPVMQNCSHIKHLKSLIGEQFPIWSIIAFSDRCTLKNIKITSTDIYIINCHNVAATIASICNQSQQDLLSANDVITLYDKLYAYTQVDETVKEQHIANIHKKTEAETPTYNPEATDLSASKQQMQRCPWCGGMLVLRTATRGAKAGNQFYGCSNYPKCKYIQNISNQLK